MAEPREREGIQKAPAGLDPAAPCGGTGLCPEAQADGVPCCELGRDCEICEFATEHGPEAKASPRPPST